MKLRVGLKYCGGCRARYNRLAAAMRIEDGLHGRVRWCDPENKDLDLLVLIQGCEVACVDVSAYGALPVALVTGLESAEEFIRSVSAFGRFRAGVETGPRNASVHVD